MKVSWRSSLDNHGAERYVIHMNSNEARENLTAAVAKRTELVGIAQALTGRKRTAAWKAVEEADMDVNFAARQVEFAVRAEMIGATEAEIQSAARAA